MMDPRVHGRSGTAEGKRRSEHGPEHEDHIPNWTDDGRWKMVVEKERAL